MEEETLFKTETLESLIVGPSEGQPPRTQHTRILTYGAVFLKSMDSVQFCRYFLDYLVLRRRYCLQMSEFCTVWRRRLDESNAIFFEFLHNIFFELQTEIFKNIAYFHQIHWFLSHLSRPGKSGFWI